MHTKTCRTIEHGHCTGATALCKQTEGRRGVPSAVFQKFEEEEVWNESYNYVNY